jgi:hypothetical protein
MIRGLGDLIEFLPPLARFSLRYRRSRQPPGPLVRMQ